MAPVAAAPAWVHNNRAPTIRGRLLATPPPMQEDYPGAVTTCSEVLAEDPKNAKALFRRGRARHGLGQLEAAADDLEAARAAAPGDGGVLRELATVRGKLREVRPRLG